jgi:hypothetical protein
MKKGSISLAIRNANQNYMGISSHLGQNDYQEMTQTMYAHMNK